MKTAEQIIKLYERLESDQANFRSLWQSTADVTMPMMNQIISRTAPGSDKTQELYDSTAHDDALDMASGLVAAFIPTGKKFFNLVPRNKALTEFDHVWRYLNLATEITHEHLFDGNYMSEVSAGLVSLVVFGTANLYIEWSKKLGRLNFRDYPIGSYQMREGESGDVDTMLIWRDFPARHAFDKWGEKAGGKLAKSASETKTEDDLYPIIHYVGPREKYHPQSRMNLNMPFESYYVNQKEKTIIEVGGYPEFSFAVARWTKSSGEVFGRGQGTEALSKIKTLQQMWKDFIECGNKINNPAREVLANEFQGSWKVKPGGINLVQQLPASRPVEFGSQGAFPVTKDILEFQQKNVGRTFYKDVFAPLMDLTGDRRTTLEIIERLKEGLRKLALPTLRTEREYFTPHLTRSVLLLVRHGIIPPPPPELLGKGAGHGFGIEYEGQLAMALRNQQSRGFQQFVQFLAGMAAMYPDAPDYIDEEGAIRRMGRSFGINEEDLATPEQVADKRRKREAEKQALIAAQAAQVGAEAYSKTSKKAEEGSLAESVMAGGLLCPKKWKCD